MSPLHLITLSLLLHLIGFALLFRAARQRHRRDLRTIGSDKRLADALHRGLTAKPVTTPWQLRARWNAPR